MTPTGHRVYVANTDDDSISAIDTATNTVIGDPIAAGHTPWTLAIAPDGRRAYVANASANSVTAIDLRARRECVATIAVGALPLAIAIAPDGRTRVRRQRRLEYGDTDRSRVAHRGPFDCGGRVSVRRGDHAGRQPAVRGELELEHVTLIDTASMMAVAQIDVDDTPAGIAIAPDGRYAYVTLASSHVMAAIDLAARRASVPAFRWARVRSVRRSDRRSSCRIRSSLPRRSSFDDDSDLTAQGFGRIRAVRRRRAAARGAVAYQPSPVAADARRLDRHERLRRDRRG